MKPFLTEVIEHLIAEKKIGNLASTTIVVPTRRAMLFVKDCFRNYMRANGLQEPVQLPQLTTLPQLFDDLSPRYKMDEIQLVCTLYRVYCEVLREQINRTNDLPLDVFYGWGRQLVQDFSNIDKAYPLVTPEVFLKNTASARELEHLSIDKEVRERLLSLISLRESSIAVAESKRKEFEVIWEQLPLIYERYQTALANYGYEGARMRAVIAHWEDERIQRRVAERQFVFAGFNYLVPVEKRLMHLLQEAGHATFYWDYPENFTANSKAFKWIIANAKEFGNALGVHEWTQKEVEVICAASSHSQAQFAHEWLLQKHHKGERSAVVICDESALEQVIYALPADMADERFKHINITKGFPLRQTEVYAQLMTKLQEKGLATIDSLMPDIPKVPQGDDVQLTWHELLDIESRFQMRAALMRFKQMLAEGQIPQITTQRMMRLLLRRYLEGISFPFHGEPLADVQVTGVLETRAMDFDNVLLLNVEEGVVPKISADLSYLPYYLRKAYGLQTHEESTDVYAYNFFRLTVRAKKVTMLFTGSESKYNRKSMSRFLRQMMASKDFNITKYILNEANTLDESVVPVTRLNPPTDKTAQAVVYISPSALNTFRTCRMKYYLHYVMGIKEPEETTAILSRADIGTLVHDSMEELYKLYAPADVPEPIPFDSLKTLKSIQGDHPMELSAVKSFITKIVQADKELAKNNELKILSMESEAFMDIDLPKVTFRVGGRIDRVDSLNGVTRIVDYKTGSYKEDYAWQIAIYRDAYMKTNNEQNVQAVLYICKQKNATDNIKKDVEPSPDFMSDLTDTLAEIQELRTCDISQMQPADILALQAVQTSQDDPCKYCPYMILCNRKPKNNF